MKVNLRLLLILCCAFSACRDGDNNDDELCGNNVIDTGEECDDGNTTGGDGCGETCLTEVAGECGDGTRNTGEGCDDGNLVDGDGCDASCQVELVETVCQELAPITTGTCEVVAGDATTALVGDVLVPEGIFRGGTVMVDAMGVISCVGCDCDTTGATVVTCPQGVISPGLINTHEHITFAQNSPYTDTGERYEHRHDWRRGGNRGHTGIPASGQASTSQIRWGELRFLLGGATSLNGRGSADGFLRNIDGNAQDGLGQPRVNYDTFPLGSSDADYRDGTCDYNGSATTMSDIADDDAYTPHISEGIDDEANNEFMCTSSNENGANDLLESQSAFIHGIGLGAQEYQLMADAQTKLIWSPRSNITLYGETARVALADNLGVTIALGTDWIPTGSMNMQRELTCADSFNKDHLGGHFSDADLWQMVTLNAAIATATDDVIGTLAMGKVADIAIYDGSTNIDYRAIIDARAQDTVMVMRGGEVLFGEESVVGALGIGTCDTIDVCGSSRQLCAENDIGMSYTALQTANSGLYSDFFCGEPENEPSCVPFRPLSVDGSTTYTGIASASDMDADGIDNQSDNCPNVFNPIRPLDHGVQADADNDGEGDSCDPCPLDADTTTCSLFDPNDADGDGIPVATDNCPNDANPGQEDMDSDNIGDICDACPDFSNLGGVACQVTIYDIKAGTVTGTVSLPETLVTACIDLGYFLQTVSGDADYTVPENSGVFVYDPTTACGVSIAMGDKVVIGNATINEFRGQIQLSNAMFTVNSSGNALPTPIVLTPAQAGGVVANEYEGVIAEVQNVSVSTVLSATEFEVDSALVISGDIFLADPYPVLGSAFPSIAGVLMFRDDVQSLMPRDASDILQGDPRLIGLSPSLSYVDEGDTNVATGPQALEVVLTHAVTVATFVSVVSNSADLTVVGGGVTIGVGQERATVLVNGIAQNPGVTLTATLDAVMVMADVRVLGAAEVAALSSISPSTSSISPNGAATLTVNLDIPAGVGGVTVALSSNDASVTVPASVSVAAGDVSATFDATGGASAGSATITATLNASMASATVDVVEGGLVINEVDYDQPGGDAAEFVEIYNGSSGTQSLANLSLVFMNGSGAVASEYDRIDLSTEVSLAPGQYLVVGAASVVALVPGTEKTIVFAGSIQNGSPDAVGLYNVSTDELVDALSYEGSTSGPVTNGGTFNFVEGTELDGMQADKNGAGEDGSLSRLPNGSDTDDANTDWAFTSNSTPGAANN